METLFASLTLSGWNPPVTGESPHKETVMRSFNNLYMLAWANCWPIIHVAGDLKRYEAHVISLKDNFWRLLWQQRRAWRNTSHGFIQLISPKWRIYASLHPIIIGSDNDLIVAYSAPSHYQNYLCYSVHWTLGNKLQWIVNHENASENIVCEMMAILSRADDLSDSQCTSSCATERVRIQYQKC